MATLTASRVRTVPAEQLHPGLTVLADESGPVIHHGRHPRVVGHPTPRHLGPAHVLLVPLDSGLALVLLPGERVQTRDERTN